MMDGAQFDQILWWCFIAITHMYEHAWRNVPCSTGRVPNAWSQKSLSKEGQKTSSFWANLYHHHLCPLNIIQRFKSSSTVKCFTRPCAWVERSGFELVFNFYLSHQSASLVFMKSWQEKSKLLLGLVLLGTIIYSPNESKSFVQGLHVFGTFCIPDWFLCQCNHIQIFTNIPDLFKIESDS